MTTKEHIEGNKLIAAFMGTPVKMYKEDKPTYIENGKQQYASYDCELAIIDNKPYEKERLKYHSSWEWLMSVVERIEEIQGMYVKIEGYLCTIYQVKRDPEKKKNGGFYEESIISEKNNDKKALVWKSVVEFIKWHNKNKK